MKGFIENIEQLTIANEYFRQVLYTATHTQLTVMHLQPKESIGEEVHDVDQFLRIEEGTGRAVLDGHESKLTDGSVVIVPAGVNHNIINDSDTEPLKLYTLYCPPHHRDGVIHTTKEEAVHDSEHFDGKTTEF
ncbi:MAG: cupin domain-containing protein [Candidatus Andersenbacteria bacterium]|nr:cupin domain-containing protein [Candidatus Andersenbacteria bacterium]MBI3250853.1 cupin domain-containing protein [Candidatus Andersenbacteria bacterium]